MRAIRKLPVVLSIMSISLFAQAPAPAVLYNTASQIPAGFPNSGVAQGAIFLVYGKNLGPPALAVAAPPLPTTAGVGGTSVTVTVGGTTVNAPMIYSVATQIGGVLPSNTPVGTGTLTIAFNGQTASIPIQVVASNFGISTINNQTGGAPAVITFPNYSVVTTTNSAAPGNELVLWGTGLGPITGSDAVIPSGGDLGTPITVYVGGVPATLVYRGRSAYPGLDQINFIVPPGVSGCYVSLVVETVVPGGNTVSNSTTMPVSPNGGICTDSFGVSLSSLSATLSSKGSVSVGYVALNQDSFSVSVGGQSFNESSSTGVASFTRYTASQLTTSKSLLGIPSVGSCSVYNFTGTTPPNIVAAQALGLNAGSVITVTTPSGTQVSLTLSGGVQGTYTSPVSGTAGALPSLTAGTYAISGTGGVDVGAFTGKLNVLPPLTWSNQTAVTTTAGGSLIGTINRTNPLALAWSGGDPNGVAVILGASISGTSSSSLGGFFYCIAPIGPDTFSVPASVLLALPPTTTSGTGILLVGSSSAPQAFAAPNLDAAYAVATSLSGASVLFQ